MKRGRWLGPLLAVPLALAGCADDDGTATAPGDTAATPPALEPAGGIGDPVVYEGGVDTEGAWELTVTVEEVACDVAVGEDVEFDPADGRFCVVTLQLRNTGTRPNLDAFTVGSTLQAGDGAQYPVQTPASEQYLVDNDLGPTVIEAGGESVVPLVFSVPEGEAPELLYLQSGTGGDPPLLIELGS